MRFRSLRLRGFTLLELIVSMAVLSILMAIVLGITMATNQATKNTSSKLHAFSSARNAFDSLTRDLSQATVNTYWDYDDPNSPKRYLRQSELHFVCGPAETLIGIDVPTAVGDAVFFQAPIGYTRSSSTQGLKGLLSNLGYYVSFGSPQSLPGFLQSFSQPSKLNRFRLIHFREPAEEMETYGHLAKDPVSRAWFRLPVKDGSHCFDLSKNIVALLLKPRVPWGASGVPVTLDATDKENPQIYDSREGAAKDPQPVWAHQLPPYIDVTLVAMDEESAKRWVSPSGANELTIPDFSNPAKLEEQLLVLENRLQSRNSNYRVYRKSVEIRSSKWSP